WSAPVLWRFCSRVNLTLEGSSRFVRKKPAEDNRTPRRWRVTLCRPQSRSVWSACVFSATFDFDGAPWTTGTLVANPPGLRTLKTHQHRLAFFHQLVPIYSFPQFSRLTNRLSGFTKPARFRISCRQRFQFHRIA